MSLNAHRLFHLVREEVKNNTSALNENEYSKFKKYYKQAGLSSTFKHNFFLNHYEDNLQNSLQKFLETLHPGERIVDLGGGMGTQAMFLAYHGFAVSVLDMDGEALNIGLKRKAHYERVFNKTLDIEFIEQNALEFAWEEISEIKGIYSLFAFNMIQPTEQLMRIIFQTSFGNGGICIIQDGNASHPIKRYLYPRASLTVHELNKIFEANGFDVKNQRLLSFPPVVHFFMGRKLASWVEKFWSGALNLNISWLHTFTKNHPLD